MSSKCQFWLSNNAGSDTVQLPVLPEQITISIDSQNETVNVSGLGEVTIIQDPAAKTYEFTSHFPAVAHQGSIKNPKAPQEYIDKIDEWYKSKKPVKFIVTGTKINTFCTIEKFHYYEQGGDPDTQYYTINLKEYREVSVRKLDTTPIVPAKPPAPTPTAPPAPTYSDGKVKTNGSRLMLRQKPSTSSKILAKMPNGSKLKIKSKTGSWYAVIYGGKDGYAYAKWVKKLN